MGIFSKTKKVTEPASPAKQGEPKAADKTPTVSSRSGENAVSKGTSARRVLIRPHASEKSIGLEPQGTYVFVVRDDANKTLVKEEVERRYGVKVVRVN
ncbi:MAG: 50S ribosomal protein L23, partial [Candidatus Jorgensenbacteria bacterium]|nr:50S ribosomal protein L23 [Candidatus Jorgensenbacteria bacterium]